MQRMCWHFGVGVRAGGGLLGPGGDVKVEGGTGRKGVNNLLGCTVVQFPDLDPADYQDKWNEPIPPWNKTPDQLIMQKQEHGKKIWSLLSRYKDPAAEVWVFQDDGGQDHRALSVALAVCDTVSLERASTVFRIGDDGWRADEKMEAPNPHAYAITKSAREMVIGEIVVGFGDRRAKPGRATPSSRSLPP